MSENAINYRISTFTAFLDGQGVYQTVDHSVPQMLALVGRIGPEEIRHHPERNVLLRTLGTEWEKPMYEIEKLDPKTDYEIDGSTITLKPLKTWELEKKQQNHV